MTRIEQEDCPTHCYAPKEREAIREVMRWAGPRMIWYAPKDAFIHFFHIVKHWLQSLSFRTGVIVLLCCIPFYILSFAQMLLPTSVQHWSFYTDGILSLIY